MSIIKRIRRYDAFAKIHDDFQTKTTIGGIISIGCIAIAFFLTYISYTDYMSSKFDPYIEVDRSGKERMDMNIDITFPMIPCAVLSVDVMDSSFDHQNNVIKDLKSIRLANDGKPVKLTENDIFPEYILEGTKNEKCGPCYKATIVKDGKIPCCNSCSEVIEAYRAHNIRLPPNISDLIQCSQKSWDERLITQKDEGCNIKGTLHLNKIPGNVHIAPGLSLEVDSTHYHDLRPLKDMAFNFTYIIHHMSFGKDHPNLLQPLDKISMVATKNNQIYTYLLKVVPTSIKTARGQYIETNQFSTTMLYGNANSREYIDVPGLYFNIDISPLLVVYGEKNTKFSSFLTNIFSIIGGVYTIANIMDSFLYSVENKLRLKQIFGKAA